MGPLSRIPNTHWVFEQEETYLLVEVERTAPLEAKLCFTALTLSQYCRLQLQ